MGEFSKALGGTVVGHQVDCRGLSHVFGPVVIDETQIGVVFLRSADHQAASPANCASSQAIRSLSL
jgi:hypothetical protein